MTALTIAGSALAIAVSWTSLGLPRPVLTTDLKPIADDVQNLEKFGRDTRLLVLDGRWWRLQTQIEDTQEKLEDAPRNRHLRDLAQRLRRDQAAVQRQIDQLER